MKLFICAFAFFISFSLFAHRVNVFAIQEGDKIFVEGYFSDGTPARKSKVEVFNEEKKKILEGITDNEGRFSFDVPAETPKLFITLDAGLGHKTETVIELTKASEKIKNKEISQKIEPDDLRGIVEESVEKALVPLMRELERYMIRAKLHEIIGGIGYIFGIFGLILFLKKK